MLGEASLQVTYKGKKSCFCFTLSKRNFTCWKNER
jgi:hypothetical protein